MLKIFSLSVVGLVCLLAAANILGLNALVARNNPALAVFTSIMPPFSLQAEYTEGSVLGVRIGDDVQQIAGENEIGNGCQLVYDGALERDWRSKELGVLDNAEGEVVFKCKSAGVPFNLFYVATGGKISSARIYASFWM